MFWLFYDTTCGYADKDAFMLAEYNGIDWAAAVPKKGSDWWLAFKDIISAAHIVYDDNTESIADYLADNPNYIQLLSIPDLPFSKHYPYHTPEELFTAHPEFTI